MTDKKPGDHWFDSFKTDGLGGGIALLGVSWISSLKPETRAGLMRALGEAYCGECGHERKSCACPPPPPCNTNRPEDP